NRERASVAESRDRARPGRPRAARRRGCVPAGRRGALHSMSWLLPFLPFRPEKAFESVKPLGPEAFVEAKPGGGRGQRSGLQSAHVTATLYGATDEPCPLEDLHVLGGGGERHGQRLRELT